MSAPLSLHHFVYRNRITVSVTISPTRMKECSTRYVVPLHLADGSSEHKLSFYLYKFIRGRQMRSVGEVTAPVSQSGILRIPRKMNECTLNFKKTIKKRANKNNYKKENSIIPCSYASHKKVEFQLTHWTKHTLNQSYSLRLYAADRR